MAHFFPLRALVFLATGLTACLTGFAALVVFLGGAEAVYFLTFGV